MIKINCCCRICKKPSIYDFDETMFCQPCFMEHIKNSHSVKEEIKRIQNQFDNFNKKRSSKWHGRKRFAYYALMVLPMLCDFGFKYGIGAQILIGIILIISSYLYTFADWLADRF